MTPRFQASGPVPAGQLLRGRRWVGQFFVLLLGGCTFAGAAISTNPAPPAPPGSDTNPPPAAITIRTSAGATIAFTPAEAPRLEIVNDALHLALRSREGMIFELTGIPAKPAVAARRYRGGEFRALLLHSGFQEEAATDDPFTRNSRLNIRQPRRKAAPGTVEIQYSGKLKAGAEVLTVRLEFTGLLPAERNFLSPLPNPPSVNSQ